MLNQAIILPLHTKVQKLLTPDEKEFVQFIAKQIVKKTLQGDPSIIYSESEVQEDFIKKVGAKKS